MLFSWDSMQRSSGDAKKLSIEIVQHIMLEKNLLCACYKVEDIFLSVEVNLCYKKIGYLPYHRLMGMNSFNHFRKVIESCISYCQLSYFMCGLFLHFFIQKDFWMIYWIKDYWSLLLHFLLCWDSLKGLLQDFCIFMN